MFIMHIIGLMNAFWRWRFVSNEEVMKHHLVNTHHTIGAGHGNELHNIDNGLTIPPQMSRFINIIDTTNTQHNLSIHNVSIGTNNFID